MTPRLRQFFYSNLRSSIENLSIQLPHILKITRKLVRIYLAKRAGGISFATVGRSTT